MVSLNNKNILITGGAEFIGSHLCDELVKDNNIICLDDFSSGRLALFDGHMITDFVLQAITNKPLTIYGGKKFTTSLCYVSDIIEGLIKLMNSNEVGPFNFGQYEEYQMTEVAQTIIKMTGSNSEIQFKDSLVFMSPLGLPDISLVKQKLGWYPLIGLDDGLERTIEYVRANKNILQPMLWKYEEDEKD